MDLKLFKTLPLEVKCMVYPYLGTRFCNEAAKEGDLELLKTYHKLGFPSNEETVNLAVEYGNMECFDYLFDISNLINHCVIVELAKIGDIKRMEKVYDKYSIGPLHWITMQKIVESGNVDCIKLCYEEGGEINDSCGYSAAMNYKSPNYVECLKYIMECLGNEYLVPREAGMSGNKECIQYLIDCGQVYGSFLNYVILSENLECVEMILELNSDEVFSQNVNNESFENAASIGNLPIMKALNRHYNWMDDEDFAHYYVSLRDCGVCNEAAFSGSLDCLKLARNMGFAWNERVPLNAAFNGHLDCLKYAIENGCPWDEDALYFAEFHGYLDCLEYLKGLLKEKN